MDTVGYQGNQGCGHKVWLDNFGLIQDPKEIKLYRDGSELSDSTTLAESKAENGDIIAMALALPGGTFLLPSQICPSRA